MDLRETVESIVREIIQTINKEREQKAQPKVLFIFCDSTAHEAFRDDFIKLKNHGICHDILFLDGETSSWLGINHVECQGAGKVIATDENAPAPIELPKEYEGIVIPEIDLDNAFRVVSGMKGTIKAEIIFSAIMLKKLVIIGEDSPGIKRSDRRCLNTVSLPGPYQKRFQQYVQEMKGLGIRFRNQKGLIDTVINRLKAEVSEKPNSLPGKFNNNHLTFGGKLLTAGWIQSQTDFPDQTIFLRKGAIVSPLAKDLLKEKGLTVQIFK
ncbi:hypothetical protein EV207_10233 [Scopulibacillus darangshiensis]|uniref:Uncharacterized protein n=1 Tax=Scopulibacillus darangshiensis TaxID=442528 RepID=A0A4R2PB71_9BACL|nr:hypothetical protein [Scopulibacillus darangshiensis]TCP31544.1 hypothetical protein EV207_10233 [Scopulibacillus darangshiensis]